MSIAHLRREYTRAGLSERDLAPDPLTQFRRWFDVASAAGVPEPNMMVLATVDTDGAPNARAVLLKGIEPRGLLFFTNYSSQKGRELEANPRAAAVFVWHDLERQVRFYGDVSKISREESADYFQQRPRGAQIGAWASAQSSVVHHEELTRRFAEFEEKFKGGHVPLPENWGGYVLAPQWAEFWQGRENRMHDRLRYRKEGDTWVIERLAP